MTLDTRVRLIGGAVAAAGLLVALAGFYCLGGLEAVRGAAGVLGIIIGAAAVFGGLGVASAGRP